MIDTVFKNLFWMVAYVCAAEQCSAINRLSIALAPYNFLRKVVFFSLTRSWLSTETNHSRFTNFDSIICLKQLRCVIIKIQMIQSRWLCLILMFMLPNLKCHIWYKKIKYILVKVRCKPFHHSWSSRNTVKTYFWSRNLLPAKRFLKSC